MKFDTITYRFPTNGLGDPDALPSAHDPPCALLTVDARMG